MAHRSKSQAKSFIDQNCENLTGHFKGVIFHNCTFKKLNGLVLEDCVLMNSRFLTDDIEDALGFTLTLQCNSFRDVEFSPLLFDLYLLMAVKSSGNTEKRKKLIEIVGKERSYELLKILSSLER